MIYPLTTTLNRIYACNPCSEGWRRALEKAGKIQGDDEPIAYAEIIDAAGVGDALWCCRAEPQHSHIWRRYAVWCARQVQHLMSDDRSLTALDVAEKHANGQATDYELIAAKAAADAATEDAVWAAAEDAVWVAVRAAAAASAWDAVAAAAAASAWDAAEDAVAAAAKAAATAAAAALARAFRQLVTTGTLP